MHFSMYYFMAQVFKSHLCLVWIGGCMLYKLHITTSPRPIGHPSTSVRRGDGGEVIVERALAKSDSRMIEQISKRFTPR